jgi:hypothetical protein
MFLKGVPAEGVWSPVLGVSCWELIADFFLRRSVKKSRSNIHLLLNGSDLKFRHLYVFNIGGNGGEALVSSGRSFLLQSFFTTFFSRVQWRNYGVLFFG